MDGLLKPCPFCGGKAVFKHHNIGGAGHILLVADATVECSKCGLVFPKRYSTVVVEGENGELSVRTSLQEAVIDWNRRFHAIPSSEEDTV
jgi:Lar family restriction alleviation protein